MTSAAPSSEPSTTNRWDIQALRGIAVGWVLLHHARLPGVPSGFLGVDIFFVISGFLITGLIQRALLDGRFSVAGFYLRRARRLLPAAYVTLALTALAAPWVLNGLEQQDFDRQLWGALGFASNVVLWRQSGYFQGAAELKPLLHFWSLSLEEQFYLLLPALLLLTPARRRVAVVAALVLVSLACCAWLVPRAPGAAFYLLPSRAWELGLGALGALLVDRLPRQGLARLRGPAVGLLLILPLWPTGPHPGPAALLVCLATLALLLMPRPGDTPPRALRGLVRLGDLSYSLYLLHWPILAFVNNAALDAPGDARLLAWRLGGLLLALALSVLMFRYVETPTRHRPLPAVPRAAAGIVLASVLLAVLPLAVRPGAATDDALLRRPNYGLGARCDFERPFSAVPACSRGTQPRWLLWGDSIAMQLGGGLAEAAGAAGLRQATKSSCGPFLDIAPYQPAQPSGETFAAPWSRQCKAFNESVLAWLAAAPEVDTVVLSSLLEQYLGESPYTTLLRWDGAAAAPVPAGAEALFAATRQTVLALRRLGKRVVFVAPPPSAELDIGACLERQRRPRWTLGGASSCEIDRARYEQRRARALGYLQRVETELDVPVLRFEPALCDAQRCRVQGPAGEPIYRDDRHLSVDGARWLARELDWAAQIPRLAR